MRYLALEQIVAIHALLVEETGGSDGIRDTGRLQSVIAAQTQEVFGTELYPTVFKKAAVMIRSIIGDHPFVDGNKRTAMMTGMTLLKLNGHSFRIEDGEIEDFAVRVATDHLSVDDIADWLERHTAKTKRAE